MMLHLRLAMASIDERSYMAKSKSQTSDPKEKKSSLFNLCRKRDSVSPATQRRSLEVPPPQVEVGDDGEDDDDGDEDSDGDDNEEEEEDNAADDDNDNDGGRLLYALIMTYVNTKQGIAMASTMLYLSLTF